MPDNNIKSYRHLALWKKSIALAKFVNKLTRNFPSNEIYGLTSQMRRAAVSVPANIAEGHARQHRNEYRQFSYHALGSIAELDTLRIIASDLGYISPEDDAKLESGLIEIQKMLNALVTSLA